MPINTAIPQDEQVHVIALEDGADLMRQAFKSREFWILVIDRQGQALLERIIQNYYSDVQIGEVHCLIPPPVMGCTFAVIAMKKRYMNAKQLGRELRSVGIFLSQREVAEKDTFIAAAGNKVDIAAMVADQMLTDPASPKVPAPAPIDVRLNWTSRN